MRSCECFSVSTSLAVAGASRPFVVPLVLYEAITSVSAALRTAVRLTTLPSLTKLVLAQVAYQAVRVVLLLPLPVVTVGVVALPLSFRLLAASLRCRFPKLQD